MTTRPSTGRDSSDSNDVAPSPVVRAILVVEDEDLAAAALKRGLESVGFRVIGPAGSGAEALRLANADRPDLALLDINMPGEMDGLAAAGRLQNELGVPAVMLSSHTSAEFFHRAKAIGVAGYVVKPAKPEELAITIELALMRFQQVQSLADRVDALEQNLADRKVIERAKGVLMKSKSITEEEAYLRLQKVSRRTHRRMVDVAKSVLDAEELM